MWGLSYSLCRVFSCKELCMETCVCVCVCVCCLREGCLKRNAESICPAGLKSSAIELRFLCFVFSHHWHLNSSFVKQRPYNIRGCSQQMNHMITIQRAWDSPEHTVTVSDVIVMMTGLMRKVVRPGSGPHVPLMSCPQSTLFCSLTGASWRWQHSLHLFPKGSLRSLPVPLNPPSQVGVIEFCLSCF